MIDRAIRCVFSAIIKENYLYCVYRKYNILVRINLISWKYEKIAVLEWNCPNLVTGVYEIDGQIVCAPLSGLQIAVYNPESGEIQYFSAENLEIELIDIMIYDHKLWLFPRNLPGKLYYFSLSKQTFFEDDMWETELRRFGLFGRIKKKCFTSNHIICMVINQKIVKYDLSTHLMTQIIMPLKGNCIDIIDMGEMYYALIENDKKIIFAWKKNENQVRKIEGQGKGNYTKLTKIGNAILMDSENNIDILIDGTIRKLELNKDEYLKGTSFISSIKFNDKWIFLPWGSKDFVQCTSDFFNMTSHEVKVSVKDILCNETILGESELLLNDYIHGVGGKEKKASSLYIQNGIGWSIYEMFGK